MFTPAQKLAAQKAIRADVDIEAGWYAHMISDQMIAKMVEIAFAAADKTALPAAKA